MIVSLAAGLTEVMSRPVLCVAAAAAALWSASVLSLSGGCERAYQAPPLEFLLKSHRKMSGAVCFNQQRRLLTKRPERVEASDTFSLQRDNQGFNPNSNNNFSKRTDFLYLTKTCKVGLSF